MKKYYMVFGIILIGIFLVSSCSTAPKACTMDAKVCPDGSAVGRDGGNNCEFFPCPEVSSGQLGMEPIGCTEEAKLCPDGSAVGRNADNNCEFDPCPDEGTEEPKLIACTMEAKLCPDGSSVGRNHDNNCEFDPCPR